MSDSQLNRLNRSIQSIFKTITSVDLFADEVESNLHSSDDEEIPFARHGLVIEPDHEEVTIQQDFWGLCAIGFILDYRKFFVNHLQQIINKTWRIRGNVMINGSDSYFYILHFEHVDDLNHICSEGPRGMDGALFALEKWRPNLVIERLQLNFVSI